MSEDFLAVIKLTTGEEIVGRVSYDFDDENQSIIIDCPVVMKQTSSRNFGYVKVEPWIKTVKETVYIIKMDKVVTITEINESPIERMYNKFVLSYYYDFDDMSSKITKEMGYVSTVKEARSFLENIFNNS